RAIIDSREREARLHAVSREPLTPVFELLDRERLDEALLAAERIERGSAQGGDARLEGADAGGQRREPLRPGLLGREEAVTTGLRLLQRKIELSQLGL